MIEELIIPAETEVSKGCHALSEPIRLEVLRLLKEGGKRPMDMEEALNIGQSKLSFHLRVLKDAGLVSTAPSHRFVWYRRDEDAISDLVRQIEEI